MTREVVRILQFLRKFIAGVKPTPDEVRTSLRGDELMQPSPFRLDRAMTFPVSPDELTGWIVQIGKRSEGRAGWYLPMGVEWWLPRKNRALWHVDPNLAMSEGQQIHDWMSFGRPHMITVHTVDTTEHVVILTGGRLAGWSWVLSWKEIAPGQTRLIMRMHARRSGWVVPWIDWLERLIVCAPFHRGLTQRLAQTPRSII